MTRRTQRCPRPGYTLLEMLVVLAVVLLIGSVILPTLSGLTGNQKVKGAADVVKARILEARLAAMEQGRPYIFSISQDGLRIRVAPDDTVEGETDANGQPVPATVSDDDFPTEIFIKNLLPNTAGNGTTPDGSTRVVTFQPDGTAQEDLAAIAVQENNQTGVVIRVRGLTGAVTVEKPTAENGGKQ